SWKTTGLRLPCGSGSPARAVSAGREISRISRGLSVRATGFLGRGWRSPVMRNLAGLCGAPSLNVPSRRPVFTVSCLIGIGVLLALVHAGFGIGVGFLSGFLFQGRGGGDAPAGSVLRVVVGGGVRRGVGGAGCAAGFLGALRDALGHRSKV